MQEEIIYYFNVLDPSMRNMSTGKRQFVLPWHGEKPSVQVANNIMFLWKLGTTDMRIIRKLLDTHNRAYYKAFNESTGFLENTKLLVKNPDKYIQDNCPDKENVHEHLCEVLDNPAPISLKKKEIISHWLEEQLKMDDQLTISDDQIHDIHFLIKVGLKMKVISRISEDKYKHEYTSCNQFYNWIFALNKLRPLDIDIDNKSAFLRHLRTHFDSLTALDTFEKQWRKCNFDREPRVKLLQKQIKPFL